MDNSFLAENFIFSQMIKKSDFLTQIKYWRDKNGREVDFIIEKEGRIDAYEVKCKRNLSKKDLFNIIYFKNTYKKANVFLININEINLSINSLQYFEVI